MFFSFYYDFAKAIDTINHNANIYVPGKFVFDRTFFQYFGIYLSDRMQSDLVGENVALEKNCRKWETSRLLCAVLMLSGYRKYPHFLHENS